MSYRARIFNYRSNHRYIYSNQINDKCYTNSFLLLEQFYLHVHSNFSQMIYLHQEPLLVLILFPFI